METKNSPYSLGFRTLENEVLLDSLPVEGKIPEWISGTLVRNGPARFETAKANFRHWFDGLGMLHKFSFRNGKVSYANRYLQSRAYKKTLKTGKIHYREFATDPCRSLLGRVGSLFFTEFTDNANVNVTQIAQRFIAMTEAPMAVEFDINTLETTGVFDYGISSRCMSTAHPHYDVRQKSFVNYGLQFSRTCTYHFYQIPEDTQKRVITCSIPVKEPAYIHSFGMTEHFLILAEFPLVVNPIQIVLSGKPFIENFRWAPERGTRFWIIDKNDGKVLKVSETEAFFSFHHINAFERGREIFMDISGYPDASVMNQLYLDSVREVHKGEFAKTLFRRYRIPLNGNVANEEFRSREAIELPRIHYSRCNTQEYRWVYGVGVREKSQEDFYNQLVRLDVSSQEAQTWWEEGCYPGEPVFVPLPQSRSEGEGILLSIVLDSKRERSFLLILDARTLEEIGRAPVSHPIPFGFHGQFFGENE
ncbi:MAG: carotenoid oxygenase family protein [Deltaproteobacteria bacterium]|nr:carotenoid oxygenase family protein [Deltaproteobacteria bacterium]